MRRIIYLLIFILVITGSVYALSLKDKGENEIINLESATLKYDFGVVEKDKIAKKTIRMKNRLEEEIEIEGAKSTCECISISVKPQKVKRNGIFEAEIIFDSKGLSQNQYLEEVVYLLTNNREYELIKIVVLAKVENPVNQQ